MALPIQTMNVSLAGGMNEKTPRELLPVGQNSLVVNGRWIMPGRVGTRLGYTGLATTLAGGGNVDTSTSTNVERLLTRNDELCYLNDVGINSFIPASNYWVRRDDVPEPHLYQERRASVMADASVQFADMAVGSGLHCIAWQQENNATTVELWAAVYDASGQLVVRTKLQTNGIRPRVVFTGGKFVVVWVSNTVANTLYASTFTAGGSSFTAPSNFITDIAGTGNNAFDVAATSTLFYVAYQNTGNDLRVRSYNSSLTLQNSNTLPGLNITLTAIYLDGTSVFVAYHNTAAGGSTDGKKLSADLATTSWTATLAAGATGSVVVLGPLSDSTYIWVARRGAFNPGMEWRRVTKSNGATGNMHQTRNVEIASKPFAVADYGESFIIVRVAKGENTQEGLVCCALGEGFPNSIDYRLRPVAKWLTAKVYVKDIGGAPQHVPAPSAANTTDIYIAYTEKGPESFARGQHVTVTKLDFGAATRWARIEDRDTALVAAGMLHQYDGENCSEIPFAYYPYQTTAVSVVAGGTLPQPNTFQYRVCYEWTDARGRVHRSTPSEIITAPATSAGNQTVRIVVPHLNITSRSDIGNDFRSKVAIVFYRRDATGGAAGSFVRLATPTGQLPDNDPTSGTDLTFNDSGSGAWTTAEGTLLYTDGGVLENAPPSSCRVLTKWDNRIWIGGCENPNSIWYSRDLVAEEPPYWHENQQILCEDEVTALANFDSALIVFAANSIWVMQGHGPNDRGEGSTYTGLIKLPSEVGCSDWRSVCVTEDGVFFQHRIGEGIFLLDRSLSVTYIGAPIETQATSLFPNITSAVAVPAEDEVRFTTSFGGIGRILVYNSLVKQWMVHDVYTNVGPRDALMWQNTYLWCKGGIFAQQTDTLRDLDQSLEYRIPLEVTTGDISIDGPLGRDRQWRIMFFGRRSPAFSHGLEIAIAYDQSDTFSDIKTWTAAEIAALTSTTHMSLEVVAKTRQEARSIRFRVRTLAGNIAPITETAFFMALALEFGKEEGLTVLPAAQKR